MALQISKDSQYDIPATYWKVVITNIDWHNKKANIIIHGFKNKAASDKLSQPLMQINYIFEEMVDLNGKITKPFPFSETDNVVEKSYGLIKTIPEFNGALDIIEL